LLALEEKGYYRGIKSLKSTVSIQEPSKRFHKGIKKLNLTWCVGGEPAKKIQSDGKKRKGEIRADTAPTSMIRHV